MTQGSQPVIVQNPEFDTSYSHYTFICLRRNIRNLSTRLCKLWHKKRIYFENISIWMLSGYTLYSLNPVRWAWQVVEWSYLISASFIRLTTHENYCISTFIVWNTLKLKKRGQGIKRININDSSTWTVKLKMWGGWMVRVGYCNCYLNTNQII